MQSRNILDELIEGIVNSEHKEDINYLKEISNKINKRLKEIEEIEYQKNMVSVQKIYGGKL